MAVASLLVVVPLLTGCSDDDAVDPSTDGVVEITGASIALPAGRNTAIYFAIENHSADGVQLVEVRSDLGSSTELHETSADDDGLMRMHPVDSVDVGPGEVVTFHPGGLHVMVFDVQDLDEGETAPIEMVFESGEVITVDAEVRSHADLLEE